MSALIVPITLEVLLINQLMRERDTFRQWRHTYTALRNFGSPEPSAFDCNLDEDRTGALLHWTLPRSLRASLPDTPSVFPLVPNRWLVTRAWEAAGQPRQKSWVIESDCPQASADGASYYLVAQEVMQHWRESAEGTRRRQAVARAAARPGIEGGAYPINLGAAIELEKWAEQDPTNLFLTAVAPGNLEFSAYVPFNEGVLSFFDELKDGDELKTGETTLRYQVTGWYANPDQDILATTPLAPTPVGEAPQPRTPQSVLAVLGWELPDGTGLPAGLAHSYYTGTAQGLRWNPAETVAAGPAADQLEHARTSLHRTVAVANTSVDAFSTLVGTQLDPSHGYDDPAKVVELLRAFHYDLLPLLNQPNGEVLLEERVRQEWFSSWAGGTQWTIVADKAASSAVTGPTDPSVSPPLNTKQKKWLAELNRNQQALDKAVAELTSRQWRLNAAWWRKKYLSANGEPGPARAGAKPALDAESEYQQCLTAVLQQLEDVNQGVKLVPKSAPGASPDQASYQAAIDAFAEGLPDDDPLPANPAKPSEQSPAVVAKKLKAVAQPRFWLPGNPVVLVSHVAPAAIASPNRTLTVTPLPPATGPLAADFPALPAGVQALRNTFLKPQANPPAPAWQHEWNPIYLEWEVLYTAVPFGNGTDNWRFDGSDYVLVADKGRSAAPQALSGRSLLSPNAQVTFKARLEQFLAHYGGPENMAGKQLQKLNEEIAAIDDWEFLSQELTGFNELLTQRDTRTFRTPTAADTVAVDGLKTPLLLSQLIGFGTTKIARYATPTQAQGLVNSVPAVARNDGGADALPFHSVRAGQFYLNHLVLYDKFGRQLDLVRPNAAGALDAEHFPLLRDAALRPTFNLSHRVTAPVQLPPRLLQPARLDLRFVDHRVPAQVLSQAPDVNPVGGWLLANHLGQSLLVFAPDGGSMGELSLNRDQKVQWMPAPHSDVREMDDITTVGQSPQLRDFVYALDGQDEAAFRTLLHVIDSTLWTTDPLGDRADAKLSVLVGRPLALVTVQVQFALLGPPLTRCDGAPHAVDTDITKPRFSIRFGNLESREDGVIGYFKREDKFGRFNSVVAPADGPAQDYVRPIGFQKPTDDQGNFLNLAFDGQAQLLTFLVDPRAAIHATTGILPVETLVLPRQFVDPALACMEISFRMGPLLSRLKTVPAAAPAAASPGPARYEPALSYLPIAEQNGAWSWWEKVLDAPGAPAGAGWKGHALTDATTTAALGSPPATLREGYLQFHARPKPEANPK